MKINLFKSQNLFLCALILSIAVSVLYYSYDLITDVMDLFDETVFLAEDYDLFIWGDSVNLAAALAALILIWCGSVKNNRRLLLAAAAVLLVGTALAVALGGAYGLSTFYIVTCLFAYWQMKKEELELIPLALTVLYAIMFFFTLTSLTLYGGLGSSEQDMETIINYSYIIAAILILVSVVFMFWNGRKSNWKGIKMGAFLYLAGMLVMFIGSMAEVEETVSSMIIVGILGIFTYPQILLSFYVLLKKKSELNPRAPIERV